MGVPSFYRWLSEKYPLVVKNVIEALVDPEVPVPIDSTQANSNGMEFGTD
jgi:5'-3' exoribonuclease 2